MQRDELRRAIERPARRARLHVEPELVDRLLAEVEGQPGALPLLSTALVELWQRRDSRMMGLAGYEQTGGVRGAVARLAEAAFDRLDPRQQPVARRILLRLAGERMSAASRFGGAWRSTSSTPTVTTTSRACLERWPRAAWSPSAKARRRSPRGAAAGVAAAAWLARAGRRGAACTAT